MEGEEYDKINSKFVINPPSPTLPALHLIVSMLYSVLGSTLAAVSIRLVYMTCYEDPMAWESERAGIGIATWLGMFVAACCLVGKDCSSDN
jgi:hypothetical protein